MPVTCGLWTPGSNEHKMDDQYKNIKIKKYDMAITGPLRKAARPRGQNRAKYRVNAAECFHCHDIMFSRCKLDVRVCSCGQTFITGGHEYFEIGWAGRKPATYKLFITQSPNDLYDDWNSKTDRYGRITRENARVEGLLNKGYKRDDEWNKNDD